MPYRLTHAIGSSTVQTAQDIRDAVAEAFRNDKRISDLPPLTVATVDHYTSKWTVVAIEWLRRRKIVDHILKAPKRICIQVLEGGMLPRGRFQFYNSVGALADMMGHLMQPLRALAGEPSVKELLTKLRIVEIKRARYNLSEDFLLDAFGARTVDGAALADKLAKDTETFGIVHLKFVGGEWDETPVFIRTGKGFTPSSKTIVVEGFDADGPVALICDIENGKINLADHKSTSYWRKGPNREESKSDTLPAHVWMSTRKFDVPGMISDHYLTPESDEYVEIFSALCGWESLDSRFFPSIDDATISCDFFYRELIRDRASYPQGLVGKNVYPADYMGEQVRAWLNSEAGWKDLGIDGE
jgi:hypothetical protein